MRILDKNTDFYDYLQNVYRDDSYTFDRTDSFVLTKEIMCQHLRTYRKRHRWIKQEPHNYNFVLLQVCSTFWLFLVEVTKTADEDTPLDYTVELLNTWKNYNKKRKLIQLDVIEMRLAYWLRFDRSEILKGLNTIVQGIDSSTYNIVSSVNKHTVCYGDGKRIEKHIPLLKASGFASYIDALDMYLALDEYFALERTASERIYSIGITDKEKVENHGFDVKTSFRGK